MICPKCHGNGYWIEQLRVMRQAVHTRVRPCEKCHSQGEIKEAGGMRYTFKIISTEEIGDDDGIIPVNCILYSEDDDDDSTHATAQDALDAAYHVRDGLSGSRGYARALETSRVLAFEVER